MALLLLLALCVGPPVAPNRPSEADFVKAKPTIGEALPDLTVYSPSGKEVKLSSLRGRYTVLVFGCLT
jgi:cytochrome oxidase Cu insertion factor (SCO1/SenC/PrrC family)